MPINRNYTKPPAGQLELHPGPHPMFGLERCLPPPPPPAEGLTDNREGRQNRRNHEEKKTYCLIVTSLLFPGEIYLYSGLLFAVYLWKIHHLLQTFICCVPVGDLSSTPSQKPRLSAFPEAKTQRLPRSQDSTPSPVSHCAELIPNEKPRLNTFTSESLCRAHT